MFHDHPVKIPTIKGKIIFKKQKSSTYILFQYGQTYKPDKQYSIPRRAVIGKRHPTDPELMFPNENFLKYFPEAAVPEELPEADRSCSLRIGAHTVIRQVAEEYKLPQMLTKWFGKDCGLLLDLVSYLIVDEENAGQYYPDFAFCHPLFSDGMRVYSDSKVCRFLKNVTKEQIMGFLDDWNKRRDRKQRIYISYDSTNKNCQAGDIDLIEYGKAKDDKGRDISEKIFSTDKSFIGSKSMRVHSIESLSAKIFIEFIALVIRNRIYNLLKETMLRMEAKANYLTVPAALRELEKIEMVRCGDRRYRLDHAVSRKQKTILSAFGLSEQDIQRLAGEVSEVLASNPSLQPDTVAENHESEEVWEYGEDEIDCFD